MDVYSIVTEKIISLLEEGVVPWRRPWVAAGLPRNLVSKRPYKGINLFLLSASKYISPYWLTLRQANQLGGNVRKGEESTLAVFWKVEEIDRDQDTDPSESDSKPRRRFVLRYYRIFNLEQCELPRRVTDRLLKIETRSHEPIATCAEIIGCMPNAPKIVHGGTKAYYSPVTDIVTLPPIELFVFTEEYYATAYHELVHSSGHRTRLSRESILEGASFGSRTYGAEELIAEMGAAYLCAESGISPATVENQASYVGGWLKRLGEDRKLVVRAAVQAQRATEYILGRVPTLV
jgi:antirestriction protein ArdC